MKDQNKLEATLRMLALKMDKLERLTMIAAKGVLSIDEAVIITGLSKGHLYRMTSEKTIPHYKQGKKLYFKKDELEGWLTQHHILSRDDIRHQADRYINTH